MQLNATRCDYNVIKCNLMQLDATNYDYDATRCDIIILDYFLNLIMPMLI